MNPQDEIDQLVYRKYRVIQKQNALSKLQDEVAQELDSIDSRMAEIIWHRDAPLTKAQLSRINKDLEELNRQAGELPGQERMKIDAD